MTVFDHLNQVINKLLVLSLLLLLLVCIITVARMSYPLWQRIKLSGLRMARWGNAAGVVFGQLLGGMVIYSPSNEEGHIFVVGGSGSGKTSALLIPTLQQWPGPFLAVDISGDISSNVHPKNAISFAPCSPDTPCYDVFAAIDEQAGNVQAQDEQLEKLSFLLMPDVPGASDASIFFTREGRKILTAALIAFYHTGLDFPEICRKVVSSSYVDLFRAIQSTKNETAALYIQGFRGTSEQNTSGCKQSVDGVLKLFATNDNVRRCLRRPSVNEKAFTPRTLETTSVFFVIPDTVLDVYGPLLQIITSQCLTYFSGRPIGATPTILFALDEFSSFTKMDIIGALQKLRKRSIRIMVLVQSLADLDRVYGEIERKSMLTNFPYKVILGAGDSDTQEYLAKLIGHKKEKTVSTTRGRCADSFTEREERAWAVEPEELGRLGQFLILLHPAGYKKLKKCFYFKHGKH